MQTHVVGGQCLVIFDHNRPVKVFDHNPKAGSNHVHIVTMYLYFWSIRQLKSRALITTSFISCNATLMVLWLMKSPSLWPPFPVRPQMPYRLWILLVPPTQLFLERSLKLPVTLMWETYSRRVLGSRKCSRYNSWWKLHHGIWLALSWAEWSKVCLTSGDGLSSLPLQQEENYLLTLSHHMVIMLQVVWTMTMLPLCWRVLSWSCHCE